jgi:hypothetical protein
VGKAISTPAGVSLQLCEKGFPLQLALIVYRAVATLESAFCLALKFLSTQLSDTTALLASKVQYDSTGA